jgi:hypothetical protein
MTCAGILENVPCQRCQVSSWHPEARACTQPDCELRAAGAKTGAGLVPSGSAPGVSDQFHSMGNAA